MTSLFFILYRDALYVDVYSLLNALRKSGAHTLADAVEKSAEAARTGFSK